MIIVAEGPSAAGKTTWCLRNHPDRFLPEDSPRWRGATPEGRLNPLETAQFWTDFNCRRWARAEELEFRDGTAVCDTDPFKLHYSWCRWRVGDMRYWEWGYHRDAAGAAFASGDLGLADLVVYFDDEVEKLRARRRGDAGRRRHRFDLHLRLRAPLREWYAAVDRLDPGRVAWEGPDGVREGSPRAERTGVALFGRLLQELPYR